MTNHVEAGLEQIYYLRSLAKQLNETINSHEKEYLEAALEWRDQHDGSRVPCCQYERLIMGNIASPAHNPAVYFESDCHLDGSGDGFYVTVDWLIGYLLDPTRT